MTQKRSRLDLHDNQVQSTTDHVMHCRKTNLYNETFNYISAADVVWSYQEVPFIVLVIEWHSFGWTSLTAIFSIIIFHDYFLYFIFF